VLFWATLVVNVGYNPGVNRHHLTPAEQDALVRYRAEDEHAHTESLFIKLNLPGTKQALWLKLTFLRRTIGRREKLVEGWGIAFDMVGDGQHVAVKNSWPATEAKIQYDCLYAKTPGVLWQHGRTEGRLEDPKSGATLAWELDYDTDHRGFRHMAKPWMYERKLPKTKACSPQIDSRFTGWVEVNGARIAIDQAPGMLGHNWGGAQGEFWTWAHCNMWDESSFDGAVFEGVTSKVKFGPVTSPLLTISHIRFPGERITLNGWGAMLKTESTVDGLSWSVAGATRDRKFEARFHAPADRFVGVDYHDPDGRIAHCLNTKIADAELTLWARTGAGWEVMLEARAERAAALEIGDRQGTRGVRTYIP